LVFAASAAVAMTGCGSDEPGSETQSRSAPSGEVSVAALGDSITSGSPGYDPDPETRAALGFGKDPESQYEYWAEQASPQFSFRNCGVFGERTDEIALRIGDCAEGADALIVQGGINDIAQGRPAEGAADDLRSMVERGKEAGLGVAIADVLPWDNGFPDADPEIRALNDLIAEIGRRQDVTVLPFYEALEDPGARGLMASGLTSDGDHPTVAGYRLLGELVAAKLAPLKGD